MTAEHSIILALVVLILALVVLILLCVLEMSRNRAVIRLLRARLEHERMRVGYVQSMMGMAAEPLEPGQAVVFKDGQLHKAKRDDGQAS